MSKNEKAAENSVLFHDSDKNYIVPVYAHEKAETSQVGAGNNTETYLLKKPNTFVSGFFILAVCIIIANAIF